MRDELIHFGILGMKWGVRRYQNKDGTRTELGKIRYKDVGSFKTGDHGGYSSKSKRPHNAKADGFRKSRRPGEVRSNKKDSKTVNRLKSEAGIRDSKALRSAREKNLDKLSTEELKKINDRLNAEEQYVRLTKGDIGRGKDYVKGIAVGATTSIATGLLIEVGKTYAKKKMKGG